MRLIYLARPIDQADDVTRDTIRTVENMVLSRTRAIPDVTVYRPLSAWATPELITGVDRRIEIVNREAQGQCDVTLAIVPRGVGTIGVPREIENARHLGQPVAVLTNFDRSFSLADVPCFSLDNVGVVRALETLLAADVPPRASEGLSDILVALDDPSARLPIRSHSGDAGYDLTCSEDTLIPYAGFADVPCGFRIALPPGTWGRIVGRSSTLRKRQLMVAEGVIDQGYRGPIFTGVQNLGKELAWVRAGERLAQLIIHRNRSADHMVQGVTPEEFDLIPHDGRGVDGFGSTGT